MCPPTCDVPVIRLVCRNTSLVDVRTAGSLFVAAWKEFSRLLLQRLADTEATSAGEISQLVKLFTELILHEIEKILLEETSKDLFCCVSQSSVPLMQDYVFVGQYSVKYEDVWRMSSHKLVKKF